MTEQLYTQIQIINHVENTSPTKMTYSFSRASRFPPINRVGKSDALYYFPQLGKYSKKAGMGYGQRSDFTKSSIHTEVVGPKRDYDIGTKHGKCYSFGLSRDKFEKAYCPGYKNIDKNVPGPAKYNILKQFGYNSPKYTLHGTKNENWTNNIMKNPGPGAYSPVIKINKNGRYPISEISNVKSVCFGRDKSNRFENYRCKIFIFNF